MHEHKQQSRVRLLVKRNLKRLAIYSMLYILGIIALFAGLVYLLLRR